MDKQNIKIMMKNFIILFCVFMTGFLGTLVLIMKRTADMTSAMVEAHTEATKMVYIFGIKMMEFKSVYRDGAYVINIIKHSLYEYFPFMIGIGLLLIVFVLMCVVKKMTRKTS